MLCYITENRYGHLEIDPVNAETSEKLRDEYKRVHGKSLRQNESLIYLQADYDVESFLSHYVSRKAAQEIREGYATKARVDDEFIYAALGLS